MVNTVPPSVFRGVDCDLMTAQGDFGLAQNMDIALLAGDAGTQQEILMRASDNPGALLFVLGWGAGLGGYPGLPMTDGLASQLEDALSAQAIQVQGVVAITVINVDTSGGDIVATIQVQTSSGSFVTVPLVVSTGGVALG
jgi:hypothetical protein